MSSTLGSYQIARSGLYVSERSLQVTGQNISNVNTVGFTRQQAMIGDSKPSAQLFNIGTGADVLQIRQIRDMFLDAMYRKENTALGYWSERNSCIQNVQTILGEPLGSGLQDSLNQFWDSWQELSKNPDSLTVRALVRQRGEMLVDQINHIGDQLDRLQNDINDQIKLSIDDFNKMTSQVAQLNTKIAEAENSGDTANDLRDQRNLLLDKISEMANADIYETQTGEISVVLDGNTIVDKGQSKNLYVSSGENGGPFYVIKAEGTNQTLDIKSGSLRGMLEARGMVSGIKGDTESGSPSTKADITFVIDTTSGSPVSAADITNYLNDLKNKGLDVNVNTINIAASDFNDIQAAVNGVPVDRPDAQRYVVVVSDKDTSAADPGLEAFINQLKENGINLSSLTTSNTGGLAYVSDKTGGNTYDIASADYTTLMSNLAEDTKNNINYAMSDIPESLNIISGLKKSLNAFVNILCREVNELHKSGKTMGDTPADGSDFFVQIDSNYSFQMGNIKLNDNLNNLNNIAASKDGSPGNSEIALAIANLRNQQVLRDKSGVMDFDNYYQTIILNVGTIGNEAATITDNQTKLVNSTNDSRQSISGVSLDEEMSNMLKFQFAYNASSRVITTIDDMIDTIINKLGTVGR